MRVGEADAGKLIATHHADGSITRSEYDALGRKTADIDQANRRTEYAYDALGRLASVTLIGTVGGTVGGASAPTMTTSYTYDEQGNKLTQTDALGRVTQFAYDTLGRETSRTLPLNQTESKQYNILGQLTQGTDFAGKTTAFAYDTVGRTIAIDYPNDADVSYTYTPTGLRATATDGRGTTTWQYDARYRLTRKTDPDGKALEYQYDDAGNLIARISANQSQAYGFDALNRMHSHSASREGEPTRNTAYQYDAVGNLAAMVSADGARTEYVYDDLNRLVTLTKRNAADQIVFAASYTLDASGLRTHVQESDELGAYRTIGYTYDHVKRLTREAIDHRDNANDRITEWTYDAVGNRQTQTVTLGNVGGASAPTVITTTYTYDANDRLLSEDVVGGTLVPTTTTLYTYDPNGNTTGKSKPGQLVNYDYDDANRLKEMRENGERTTYQYDVDGIRVSQTKFPQTGDATTTKYLVDSNYDYAQVAEEYTQVGNNAETLSAVFAYGHTILSQTRYTPAGGNGTVGGTVGGTSVPTTRYIHADGFGSTRYLTDSAGAKTDSVDYDAFGNEIGRTGTTDVEHLYRGEQYDPNLGFYNLRARYYDPNIGRFATMDSFRGFSQDPVSLHKYLYTGADPVNGFDPSGFVTLTEIGVVIEIRGILSGMQADLGDILLQRVENPTEKVEYNGWAVVASLLPFGTTGKLLTRGLKEIRVGRGVVRFNEKFLPSAKEIEAASAIGRIRGSRVYLRGDKVKGADALIDGVKWEIKVLNSPTDTAVAGRIKRSIKRGQSTRIVFDGRASGVTVETVRKGVARAARDGYNVDEVMVILSDDTIAFL